MKVIYTVGTAVLVFTVTIWWFTRSAGETDALSVRPASSDGAASQRMAGNIETPQQHASRQQVARAKESTAGGDVGSGGAVTGPSGNATPSTSGTAQAVSSTTGTGQIPQPGATETIQGQAANNNSSQPSAIDKTNCEAAARTVEGSWSIYNLTATQAIAYAWSEPYPHAGRTGFTALKERLLAPLCSGTSAFDPAYPVQMQFVAIGTDAHVRILVGDRWISEGTVLSPLPQEIRQRLANEAPGRLRADKIHHLSREEFERRLARNPRSLLPPSMRNGQ